MTVPDFQTIMLPLLTLAADGSEHKIADAITALATEFRLSDADRAELLPSGKQSRFSNRVGWARTYLSKAGLLESTGHGRFRLTVRGRDVLNERPAKITVNYLERFDEYVAFKTLAPKTSGSLGETTSTSADQTPEELMSASHAEYLRGFSEDLLQQVKQRSPAFFENLVVDLVVRMGYGGSREEAGKSIGRAGDGGVDGIIKEDKLGLDVVYLQAKRWEGPVGRPTVQAFAGSLEGFRANKGVMITTSRFSDDAREYVRNIQKKIVLIDGPQLVQYMIEYGLGAVETAKYSIMRIALDELDYYDESNAAPTPVGTLHSPDGSVTHFPEVVE